MNPSIQKVRIKFIQKKIIIKLIIKYTTKQKSDVKLDIRMNGTIIKETQTVKYLDILIDNSLKWNTHINHISNIVSRNIGIISRSRHFLTEKHRNLLYNDLQKKC